MKALIWSIVGALSWGTAAFAGNTFGTVEASLTDPENPTISVFMATSELNLVDNAFVVRGTTLQVSSGRMTPVEVRVPENFTLDMALSTAAQAKIDIEERFKSEVPIGEATLTKTIYSVAGARAGSIVVTDDPLPALAYIVIAGVAVVVGTETASAAMCDGEYKRVYDFRPLEGVFRIESSCVRNQQ